MAKGWGVKGVVPMVGGSTHGWRRGQYPYPWLEVGAVLMTGGGAVPMAGGLKGRRGGGGAVPGSDSRESKCTN